MTSLKSPTVRMRMAQPTLPSSLEMSAQDRMCKRRLRRRRRRRRLIAPAFRLSRRAEKSVCGFRSSSEQLTNVPAILRFV